MTARTWQVTVATERGTTLLYFFLTLEEAQRFADTTSATIQSLS